MARAVEMARSECNDLLVAPKSSAYVSNHEIRHVCSCESCGHEIQLAVNLRFDNHIGTESAVVA
jgi:hypothetical protein